MTGTGKQSSEVQWLRERNSTLCSAMSRIGSSLDPATVLQEAVDSACLLTGASVGVIVTIDETGKVRDFVTSGFTEEQTQQFARWPDGPRLFEHLRDLPGPTRLADLPAWVRERGFSPELIRSRSLQSMPICHRGERVGNFFLGEKAEAEAFTAEDEELLALFASQAAAAIVNARTYRNEQRARADLEALIDTCPVGVAVCDADTGRPVSFNLEAMRIFERLLDPDLPPEEAFRALTCRFADGTEMALQELLFASVLGGARTMRAEQVEFSVPDGRRVRTLVNVTPIRSQEGRTVSVVVTIQDLAPLEELEKMQGQFVGMVSHGLRAPLAAIKGSAAAVLGASPALPKAEMLQFFRIVNGQADHMRGLVGKLLDVGRIEAGVLSVEPVPTEVRVLVDAARNTFISGGAGQTLAMDLPDRLPQVAADRDRIVQVLNNLLANAARHSPASSPIRIAAALEGEHVAVSVCDEGQGLPPEKLGRLFRKHIALDSADTAEGTGPSGLGLAICKGLVEAHGGRIRAESPGPGQGTCFTFTLPVAEPGAAAPKPEKREKRLRPVRSAKRCVLVVDDDPQTRRLVRHALNKAGYGVVQTGNPEEVAGLIRAENPRLVLLDLMLPEVDGFELMEKVPELSDLPVIFISGYGREETIARAFETGAEDYIVKPFSPRDLVARVDAALRRRAGSEPFVHGELTIDYERRHVTVGDRVVPLTSTEYDLLSIFSVNAGRVVSSESLVRQVWGERTSTDAGPVRAFVKKLRDKLGDSPADPTWIFNVHGVGYCMSRPGEEHAP